MARLLLLPLAIGASDVVGGKVVATNEAALARAPSGPQPEGLMKCSIVQTTGPKDPIWRVHMESVTPTLPYKSSYCRFESNDALMHWDDSTRTPECEPCTRSIGDPNFSLTCHCTCPVGTQACNFTFTGTATWNPYAKNPSCHCNGEPPSPPGPTPPPVPPGPAPPCKAKLDVVVILDGSASIQASDWQKALDFTNKLVNGFNITSDQVNLGVVQFSETADIVINLSDDPAAIHTAITNLVQMKLDTNTYDGFDTAKTIFDTKARPNTAGKIAILMTDGMQNQGPPAKGKSDAMKAENITIFGIGVGPAVQKTEIESWVSVPATGHYFQVTAFSQLEKILQSILAAACKHPHPPSPPNPALVEP